MDIIKGIAVSPGIVVGKALLLGAAETHVPRRTIAPREVDAEVERFRTAVAAAIADLGELRRSTEVQLGAETAKIFSFHEGMLQDRTLLDPILRAITGERLNAEAALTDQFERVIAQFRAFKSDVFEQKVDDLVDLERRVLGKLMGEEEDRLARLTEPAVIIAHELTPSQAAAVGHGKALAFVTELGGLTGHVSIVFRALGLPAVVGCTRAAVEVQDGDEVIVDGDEHNDWYLDVRVDLPRSREAERVVISLDAVAT